MLRLTLVFAGYGLYYKAWDSNIIKESLIMNYEQKYKEALEKARKKIENSRNIEMVSFIEDAFSELKDSKDEKIRKELIKWMKDFPDEIWRFLYKKDVIAWLEKHDDNTLIEEIKRRKEILLEEKEIAVSYTGSISLGARIAMLEELLAFVGEKA